MDNVARHARGEAAGDVGGIEIMDYTRLARDA